MLNTEIDIVLILVVSAVLLLILAVVMFYLINKYQKKLVKKQLTFYNAVIASQEAEQTRIANDLHDQIGPILAIVKSQMNAIDTHHLSAIDKELKNNVDNYLTQAVHDVRRIAHNLLPATFSDYGFEKSIQFYVSRIKEFSSQQVEFKVTDWPKNIDVALEVNIYRIIQELFTNSLKHAKADKIFLNIYSKNKTIFIDYFDNGIGFNEESVKNGLGLRSIKNRLNLIKAKLNFKSTIGFGTNYKIEIRYL